VWDTSNPNDALQTLTADALLDVAINKWLLSPIYKPAEVSLRTSGNLLDDFGPGAVDGGGRMVGRSRVSHDKWSTEDCIAMLENIHDQYPSITQGWTSFDGAYFHFYGGAALTHTGAPVLKAKNREGEGSRENRWVAMHFPRKASERGAPPPYEYESEELYSREGLPRDLETEWFDFQFETKISCFMGGFVAMNSRNPDAPPIRVLICQVYSPTRIPSSHMISSWEVPAGHEPIGGPNHYHAIPLDYPRMQKLSVFHVPSETDEGVCMTLGVTRGDHIFTPVLSTTVGAGANKAMWQ